ncbi:MAG TPA: hypothetical protein VG434_01770 [Sphingomicrobium sp.]|nr:hypothetical protein [Sphingomicrobium sp.]
MTRTSIFILLGALALAGCNKGQNQQQTPNKIRVTSQEQEQLHQLDAFNLAIGLKRAIYDAGYSCKRITDAGFVGSWKNLDEWTAHCVYDNGSSRDWAIFAGPDGSAQVRDCKDVPGSGLPPCVIKQRPKGSFTFTK